MHIVLYIYSYELCPTDHPKTNRTTNWLAAQLTGGRSDKISTIAAMIIILDLVKPELIQMDSINQS